MILAAIALWAEIFQLNWRDGTRFDHLIMEYQIAVKYQQEKDMNREGSWKA